MLSLKLEHFSVNSKDKIVPVEGEIEQESVDTLSRESGKGGGPRRHARPAVSAGDDECAEETTDCFDSQIFRCSLKPGNSSHGRHKAEGSQAL